jgi:glycosyltransferase involved in cell wall biosynthesis
MSMEHHPTIWINVTTSANWHRPAVGIVRVERELRDNLRKLYPVGQFKECIWTGNGFAEFETSSSDAPSSDQTAGDIQLRSMETGEPMYLLPVLPKRQAIISIAQGALSLAPARLRPMLDRTIRGCRVPIVKAINAMALRRARKRARLNQIAQPASILEAPDTLESQYANLTHPFNAGDVLISVGLDWSYPFYKFFYFLRTREQMKIVTCCYDLIPVLYPQYCVGEVAGLFTSYFLDIADGSDLVLCISRQTEKDLLEMIDRTGGRRVKTRVFPLGDNVPSGGGEISLEVEEVTSQPFILFVSSVERRKNHEVLYRAYHLLCKEGKRSQLPKLVFVGMPGWGVGDLLKDIELDPVTNGMIVQLKHVNDAELLRLYQSSLFCVFPSLYEGWGLPVGEALSLGKAVLCSDRGSLPEVGGDLVRYIDPWNTRSWADEIYRMATDDAWRLEWEGKAKLQYRARTWVEGAVSVGVAIETLEKKFNKS